MTSGQKRAIAIIGIFGAGAFFIWIGFDGWLISSLPAHYLGYIVLWIQGMMHK
jgi:hypothetical protein